MPVFLFVAGSRKSPSSTKLRTEATAPPCCVEVGRMMETGLIKEQGRLRHDQVGLELVGNVSAAGTVVRIDSDVQVGKCQITIGDIGRVARLVVPSLEVRDLRAADTQ